MRHSGSARATDILKCKNEVFVLNFIEEITMSAQIHFRQGAINGRGHRNQIELE